MFYNIKINNKYDSSLLLFSIPVHEKQDIINNQIENILNYNPNSNIILHVNKSFKNFNPLLTSYPNVYINSESFNYEYAKGLLWIHINNFLHAIKLNIKFKYFIIISSNEMFIKYGLNRYIDKYKNGMQLVKFDPNIKWHNFQKGIEKTIQMKDLLNDINLDTFYGGQTEGQFYEKYIFQKICEIYIKHYGTKELNNFETEEIIAQTIFKSFNLEYSLPITIQNYTNNLSFEEEFIEKLKEGIIIPYNFINETLLESPHINQDCSSIFSIKRVDRSFNNIRNYLSKKGFILNKNFFQLNTYFYSNNSSLYFYNTEHLHFRKKNDKKEFNWFGIEIDKGNYYINFEFKSNININYSDNIGLIINDNIIYNFFLNNFIIGEWNNISFPIDIHFKQIIKFSFDNYIDNLDLEIKKIEIKYVFQENLDKENIIICLYEQSLKSNINYSLNYYNIYNKIILPFEKIYNIYIFISLFSTNNIINFYKPYNINIFNFKQTNINEILILNSESIINFNKYLSTNIKFVIYLDIESIFKESITNFNFYINKFNILSYLIPYIEDTISNSHEFISVPYKYLNIFYDFLLKNKNNKNICFLIYSHLKDIIGKNNFNFIYDNNYENKARTPLIKYLSEIKNLNNNNGFLLNNKYLYDIIYYNKYSKLLKINSKEYYYFKEKTVKKTPFQWLGLEYLENKKINFNQNITIKFEIKLIKNIFYYENINYGLKTHEPLLFIKNWIKECEIDKYKEVEIKIKILNKKQFIIFNFDDYLDEIEFYVKDFKIILDYN
jgi:hypothetical protein